MILDYFYCVGTGKLNSYILQLFKDIQYDCSFRVVDCSIRVYQSKRFVPLQINANSIFKCLNILEQFLDPPKAAPRIQQCCKEALCCSIELHGD